MKTNRKFTHQHQKNERKTLIIWLVIILILASIGAMAQTTVKRNEKGLFCEVKQPSDTEAKLTGDSFIDSKGKLYPVYVSKSGKYYVLHTSKKTGATYKHYLKLQ